MLVPLEVVKYSSKWTGHDLMDYVEPYLFIRFYELSVAEAIHPVVNFCRPAIGPLDIDSITNFEENAIEA